MAVENKAGRTYVRPVFYTLLIYARVRLIAADEVDVALMTLTRLVFRNPHGVNFVYAACFKY